MGKAKMCPSKIILYKTGLFSYRKGYAPPDSSYEIII